MKVLIDCDVLLDVGLNREPFVEASAKILDYFAAHPGCACVAWHSLSNLYYINAKAGNTRQVRQFIAELCEFLQVPPVGNHDVRIAVDMPLADFEDALQCAVAMAGGATMIITRNITDYANAPLPTITPEEYVKKLESIPT